MLHPGCLFSRQANYLMSAKVLLFLAFVLVTPAFSQSNSNWRQQLDSILTVDPFAYEVELRALIKRVFDDRTERYLQLIKDQEERINTVQKTNDTRKIITEWLKLVFLNEQAGRYNQATKNLLDALIIAEKAKDSVSLGKIKIRIDDLNYVNFGVTIHKENTLEGIRMIKQSTDPEDSAYYHLMESKLATDRDSFIYHASTSYNIQRRVAEEDPQNSEKQIRLAKYLNSNSIFAADPVKNLTEAIAIATKYNEHYFKLFYLNNLGYVYESRGENKKALEQYFTALQICFEYRYPILIRNTTSNISRVYRTMGEYKKATWFSKIQIIAIEAGHAAMSEVRYDDLRIQYEVAVKESLLTTLKKESGDLRELINLESWQKYILAFGVVVLLTVAIHIQIARKKIDAVRAAIQEERDTVTGQKAELEKLYAELSENEKSLQEAQSVARLANWQWNVKEKSLTYSKNLPALFSLTVAEIQGDIRKSLLAKVHRDDLDRYKKYMFADHITWGSGEVTFRIFAGRQIRWFTSKYSVLYDSDNNPEKIVHTVQDITLSKIEEENRLKLMEQRSFTRQLIEYQENERKRIAGELHDVIGQEILLLKSKVQLGLRNSGSEGEAKDKLKDIGNMADGMIQTIREISFDLSPVHLERVGLTETIKENIAKLHEVSGINFQQSISNIDNLFPPSDEVVIFRIIQEAVNNIIKHSCARHVTIEITSETGLIYIYIADDGIGFKVNMKKRSNLGFGLGNIYNRVDMLKGRIRINSSVGTGKGTEILIRIPVRNHERKHTNNHS